MKAASRCLSFTLLLATLAASSTIHAQQPAKNDPVAIMQAYWDALNSANLPAVMALISDDLAPYTYATCTPQMSAKQCFGSFVETTIIKRNAHWWCQPLPRSTVTSLSPSLKYAMM